MIFFPLDRTAPGVVSHPALPPPLMTLPLAFINGLGIGPAEMGLVFFVFLLLFGAKKLPEIARTLGKLMEEMRRASNEFKSQLHEAGNPIQEIRSEVSKEISAIQVDTARYFLTTAIINAALGLMTALVLWALGISEPLLWGAVVGVLNFIPYLGAMVSVTLMVLVGVLQSNSADVAMLPALCFLALTVLEGQFLSPLVLGKRLSLSPVAILLWLMLWGWLWGIAGVILGVPMLMCLKLSCERLPAWNWVARLIE